MSMKEWVAIAVVIGGGILLQIPGHDAMEMSHEGMEHSVAPEMEEVTLGLERVELHVSGMT